VANLLAVAILGGIAVASLNHALDRDLQTATLSETTRHTLDSVRGQLVIDPALAKIQGGDRPLAQLILKGALAESIRSVLLVAALLALSAAAAGTLLPGRSASGTKALPGKIKALRKNEMLLKTPTANGRSNATLHQGRIMAIKARHRWRPSLPWLDPHAADR
jgi:hypothetical protein